MRNILLVVSMLLLSSCSMMVQTTRTLGTVSVYTDTGEHFATYNAELNKSESSMLYATSTKSDSPIKLGGVLNFYDRDTGNYKLVSGGIIVCEYKTIIDSGVNNNLEKNTKELEKNAKELEKNAKKSEYESDALTLYSIFKENYESIESLPEGSVVKCPICSVEFIKKSKNNNFYSFDCRWLYDACTKLDKHSRPTDYKFIIDEYNRIIKKYTDENR